MASCSINKKPSILIVGCGITGAATSYFLKRNLGEQANVQIWEKARGAGGRMSTNRAPGQLTGMFSDLGAQYITKNITARANEDIYSLLSDKGLIQPFSGMIAGLQNHGSNLQDYICPMGLSSIVKYFSKETRCDFNKRLLTLNARFSEGISGAPPLPAQWEAFAEGEEASHLFDVVVMTIPVPQILQLNGDFLKLIEPLRDKLETVTYSSRWALAAYYPSEAWSALADVPWSASYVSGCEVLRYISVEQRKRGEAEEGSLGVGGPVLLFHTSVPFGLSSLNEDRQVVEQLILEKAILQLPGLASFKPESTKLVKWLYSQVYNSFPESPDFCMLGGDEEETYPVLVLTGDAFSSSGFDNCVHAAENSVRALLKTLPIEDIDNTSQNIFQT